MSVHLEERRLPLYRLAKMLSTFVLHPFFEIEINGRANIPDHGSFLLLPKHQRWEDVPLLAVAIARPLYFIAKHELFLNPLSGRILSALGGLPLNRTNPAGTIQSLKMAFHLLKKNEGIVIFPEGTYYREMMGEGRKGLISMILSRYRAPLIPVGIRYSRGGKRTRVRIEIGLPILSETSVNTDDGIDFALGEIARLSGLKKNNTGEDKNAGN